MAEAETMPVAALIEGVVAGFESASRSAWVRVDAPLQVSLGDLRVALHEPHAGVAQQALQSEQIAPSSEELGRNASE